MPGEDINLDAEIHNRSRREISTSYVTMQQVGDNGDIYVFKVSLFNFIQLLFAFSFPLMWGG